MSSSAASSAEEPRRRSAAALSASRTASATPLVAAASASDSCYFPGCRKDANCSCEICLASFQATRDLAPRPRRGATVPARKPIFDPVTPPQSPPVTTGSPATTGSTVTLSATPPVLKSTARSHPPSAGTAGLEKKRNSRYPRFLGIMSACIVMVWIAAPVLAMVVNELKPRLSLDVVSKIREEAVTAGGSWAGTMRILENQIGAATGRRAVSCSTEQAAWELRQETRHSLLRWQCTLYKSVFEEVIVWGSPIKASGTLPASLSLRSFTILSGSITEWYGDGRLISLANAMSGSNSSSWWSRRSVMPVQLEPGTYVLQYEQSALLHGPALLPAAMQTVRARFSGLAAALRARVSNAAREQQLQPT